MTAADDPLEAYLRTVRGHLRGLSPAEARETIAELRSHVLDRLDGDSSPARLAEALASLGDAQELARINARERVAARGGARSSPLALFGTAAQLAALSLRGLWVFLVCLAGYGLGLALIACAVIKPFRPGQTGLWRLAGSDDDYSLALGFNAPPAGAHELLGWWIIPIGLVLGLGVAALTHLFARRSIRRMAGSRWGGEP